MRNELGRTARDRITGTEGVITGHCAYITGCNQVLITPKGKKGQPAAEPRWVDEQRVELVGKNRIVLDNSKTPGFDIPAPIR